MTIIKFLNADIKPKFQKPVFKSKLITVLINEGINSFNISYILCSDNYLLEINQKFLNHDYYTDIITFNLSKNGSKLESEIYISSERVYENAKTLNIEYETELLRVMIHGLLHLCGYNDKNKSEKNKMREKENFYVSNVSREI